MVPAADRAGPARQPCTASLTPAAAGQALGLVDVAHENAEQERQADEELAAGAHLPPGWIHIAGWADSEFLKQFVSEQLVTIRNKRGFARLEWHKMRERNEALDCRVYARAAAWIVGIDRFSEARWKELEAQIVVEERETVESAEDLPRNAGVLRRKPSSKRRTFHSSYLR